MKEKSYHFKKLKLIKGYWAGKHRSEKTKQKISNSLKGKMVGEKHPMYGKRFSEEYKRKLSESHKGQKAWNKGIPHSEETKEKLSRANKGKKLSEETKKKISESLKGHFSWNKGKKLGPHSEETKRKISELHKGRPGYFKGKHHSEETKNKIRETRKGKYIGENTSMYGKHHSEETKQRMREKALQRTQTNLGFCKDTKPELKMKDILNELNIPFKHQFRLNNHLFDFHLLNTNVLIEVDGDYWHSNPKKFKKLNKIQLEQKIKDNRNNEIAKENNFILLRFWENDILNNVENVKNVLRKNS